MPKIINTLGNEVAGLLRDGRLGIIPTDTVYGLVCSAANQQTVERLYKLKSRENKPGTIIAASVEQLAGLGIKARYLKAVEHFWPNPISIIIPTGFDLPYLHLGKMSLAVRIPKNTKLLQLLDSTGPLLTSSANHPGEPEAATIEQAIRYFGDEVDFYVDGGDLSGRKPSTLIRIVDDAIEVLRQGAVNIDEAGRILD